MTTVEAERITYDGRIAALRNRKLEQTRAKQAEGPIDGDDKGRVLPPEGWSYTPLVVNHPSGSFFGMRACGKNFRALLETHPVYVDPNSSLAGAWMDRLLDYRKLTWPPEFDYSHLRPEQQKYNIVPGIGAVQHFCPDVRIGLELGWGGLLEKVRRGRKANPSGDMEFYDALEDTILGVQGLDPASRRGRAHGRRRRDKPGTPARLGGHGGYLRTAGERSAAHVPRGVPVDRLDGDGRLYVQPLRCPRSG